MNPKIGLKNKFLVLDASVTVQKLVHLTFADSEWEVVTALDANDALQKVKSLKPLLVFTDTEGLNAIGEAVQEWAHDESLPLRLVLFVSGEEKWAEGVSVHGVLKKPFQSRDLKEIVVSLLKNNEERFRSHREESQSTLVEILKSAAEETLSTVVERVAEEQSATLDLEPITTVPIPTQERPSQGDDLTAKSSGPLPTLAESFDRIAREEIRKWLDTEMPLLAQRLLREEIEKQLIK